MEGIVSYPSSSLYPGSSLYPSNPAWVGATGSSLGAKWAPTTAAPQVSGSASLSSTSSMSASAVTGYPAVILADSPIGYWRLGEASGATTAVDSSGNGRNGTVTATVAFGATGLVTGDTNTAATFSTGNIMPADSPVWDVTTALTVEALIKIGNTNTEKNIISRDDFGSNRSWRFRVNNATLEFIVFIAGTTWTVSGPSSLVAGTKYHVAGTFDGTTMRLYVNGSMVASQAASGSVDPGLSPVIGDCIGSSNPNIAPFVGVIDEAAIYNTTLSASRISAHYSAVTPAPTLSGSASLNATSSMSASAYTGYAADVAADSPVGWWRQLETSGTTIIDSARTNNGTYASTGVTLGQSALVRGDASSVLYQGGGLLPSSTAYNTANYTIEAWIKIATPSYGMVNTQIINRDFSSRFFQLRFNSTVLEFIPFDFAGNAYTVDSTKVINDGQIHHIAARVNGTEASCWVDGVKAVTTMANAALTSGTQDLQIGYRAATGTAPPTSGVPGGGFYLDEIAYYPTALSDARIIAHYNSGVPAFAASLNATSSLTATPTTITASLSSASSLVTSATTITGSGALTSISSLAAVAVPSGYPSEVIQDNPLVYWRLGDATGSSAVADATVNGRSGSVSSVTLGQTSLLATTTDTSALSQSGALISAYDATWMDVSTWSVELWAKIPTTVTAAMGLACRDDGSGSRHWDLHINDGAAGKFDIRGWNSAETAFRVISTATANDNVSHHVVATYDGSNVRLYVDGVLQGTTAATGLVSNVTSAIRIFNHSGFTAPAGVFIDEFAYYGSALSSARVTAHYNAGTSPSISSSLSSVSSMSAAGTVTTPPVVSGSASLSNTSSFNNLSVIGATASSIASPVGHVGAYSAATRFKVGPYGAKIYSIDIPITAGASADSIRVGFATSISNPSSVTWVGGTAPSSTSVQTTTGVQSFPTAVVSLAANTYYYLVVSGTGLNGADRVGTGNSTPAPTGDIAVVDNNNFFFANSGATSWSSNSFTTFLQFDLVGVPDPSSALSATSTLSVTAFNPSTVSGAASLGATSTLVSSVAVQGDAVLSSTSTLVITVNQVFAAAALAATATIGSTAFATKSASTTFASSSTMAVSESTKYALASLSSVSGVTTTGGRFVVADPINLIAATADGITPDAGSVANLSAASAIVIRTTFYIEHNNPIVVNVVTAAGAPSVDAAWHIAGVAAKVSVPDLLGDVKFGPLPPVPGSDTAQILVYSNGGSVVFGSHNNGDFFASPIVMNEAAGSVNIDPGSATLEPGEPATSDTGSIWLYLQPSTPGYLTVRGDTTTLDYSILIYQGNDLASLSYIDSVYFASGGTTLPELFETVAGGVNYYVRVTAASAGVITVDWSFDARRPQLVFQLTSPLLGANSAGVLDTTPGSLNASIVGADPNEAVSFSLPDGTFIASYTADDTGVLNNVSLDIPELAAGQYNITATALTSGRTDVQVMTITNAPGAHPTLPAPDTVISTIPAASVNKWVFVNPPTGETYTLPINPNRMTSPHAPRNVFSEATTAPDGQMIMWEGARRCQPWTIEGFILDQAHYEKMEQFLALNNRIIIVDHRLRAWICSIESFEPQKIGYETNPYWAKYSLTAFIYGGGEKVTPA